MFNKERAAAEQLKDNWTVAVNLPEGKTAMMGRVEVARLVEQLEARIEAALALHYEFGGLCNLCGELVDVVWPCPTIKALQGEK